MFGHCFTFFDFLNDFRGARDSKRDVPARQLLDFVGVLAKSTAVLAKFRSARPLEEQFRVHQGVTPTKTEHTEVFNSGGTGGEALHQVSGFASRMPCIDHRGARDESTSA